MSLGIYSLYKKVGGKRERERQREIMVAASLFYLPPRTAALPIGWRDFGLPEV